METPIGSIIAWAGSLALLQTATTDWLICDGSKIPRRKFPDLCDVISDYWGPITGDNNDEYTLPDLRGIFLRGVNQGRDDEYADPDVNLREKYDGKQSEGIGSFQKDEFKRHTHNSNATRHHQENKQPGPHLVASGDNKATIDPSGGNETRPKNAYIYYIIKAK
ncbi:phage tail protein [Chondrinema litorale]|uniref:phage tail protein n=1 Tax=Chondrinema litorale TaxID=2994555 RepID=UPI002542D7D4|nr:phage tail protein [Chondrinema litorale]UZS00205.1 phage tail protein [Chondrinema litorale]